MTRIGYARVSTLDQNLDRQLKALKEAGCEKMFQEKISGKNTDRPELQKMINELKAGDEIVIMELARFSRSTRDFFELLDIIKSKGSSLRSIKEKWLDTTDNNPTSELLMTIMAGFAQFERALIKQRQAEGVAIAKEKGKYKGRLRKYTEKHAGMIHALELVSQGEKTIKEICEITKVSRSALYREMGKVKS